MSEDRDRKPIAWRVRPYEADTWIVVTEPPTDETRRFMEFVAIYDPAEAAALSSMSQPARSLPHQ